MATSSLDMIERIEVANNWNLRYGLIIAELPLLTRIGGCKQPAFPVPTVFEQAIYPTSPKCLLSVSSFVLWNTE